MAWDDPKHEPDPKRDPGPIDPGSQIPYPHHRTTPDPTPTPSGDARHRGVTNPSTPSDPFIAPIAPPPSIPPPGPTANILPAPIWQAGPQRTDVFVSANKVPLPVVYGATRMGAQVWYRKVQPDNTEVVLYAVCQGPINSISNILIEGKPIAQFATTEVYTGTSGQALSTIGSTAEPTLWTSTFPYVAYVVARFANPSITHATPDVMRFTCDVQGMLVRDPRTDATLVNRYYRDNVALCLADFLSSPSHNDVNGNPYTYGAGIADANMDFAGTITTAANDCDVLLADGTSKRFTIGLAMLDKRPISDWIESIRSHGQLLRPIYNNGLFQIVMDKAQASSGIALTSQGSTANIIACSPLVMKPSSQIPSRVIVNFINAAANYKNDSVQNDDPGIAGGTVDVSERTYELGQITFDQASRLAKYFRKRASGDKSGVIRVNAEGLQLLPGLRIPVTSDQWNVSAADMLISDLNSSSDQNMPSAWDVTVEFYTAGTYDDTQSSGTPHAPPLSPTPYDIPRTVEFVSVNYDAVIANELRVSTLVAANSAAALGSRIINCPSTRLALAVATGDTKITVKDNFLANGDVLYLETSRGGVHKIEYMATTSAASANGPNWDYNVTRNLDGSGADAWLEGDAVFDTGQAGSGFIDMYTLTGVKSTSEKGPTIVGNIRNSTTYNDWSSRWAIGNLNGLYGYVTDTYGVAMGVPTGAWVKIDPTNGVRIGFNATTNIQLDAAGNASFIGSITAASGTIGGWTLDATSLSSTGVKIQSDATAAYIAFGTTPPTGPTTGTGIYMDKTGLFGLLSGSQKFKLDATNGSLTAISGGIGGWTIGSTSLSATNVTLSSASGGSITAGNVTIKNNEIDISTAAITWDGPNTRMRVSSTLAVGGALYTESGNIVSAGNVQTTSGGLMVSGTKVVGAQGAAVADSTDTSNVATQLNALLARLRTHGLIAT